MHQRRKMTFNLMQKPEQASRRISAVVHISSPKFNNFQPYTQQQINQQIMLSNKLQQHQQQRLSIQSRISIQHDLIPQSLIQHERRLLIQAVIQFFIEFSLSSIWFLQMIDCLPDGLLTNVLANWYWIFYNGFRPLVYLAMNKTIRQRIISLWLNRQLESTAEFAKIPRVIPQEIRVTARPIPLVNEPI
ncbi:hypothetical protein Mgra_00007100 [Meloidogyne graminicola]|uniref:Uncharacterized protein n=1 Tax=Meloidogyne graminicola TaxID=189291 RepID=A0A8S9ZJP4_9BILA|nr:hypothetical protein Mgra_00007100 [Meloidogyne graminicola]